MIEIGPDSQTRRGNRIFRRRFPVHLYCCRFSLTSHTRQAGVISHLEGQDKLDQKPNGRADEVCTAQQLLFIRRDSVSPNVRLRYGLTRERCHRQPGNGTRRGSGFINIYGFPRWWFRYVNDSVAYIKSTELDNFHRYRNAVNPHIQFTVERATPMGDKPTIAFLDTNVSTLLNGEVEVQVYRKSTNTNQHLTHTNLRNIKDLSSEH